MGAFGTVYRAYQPAVGRERQAGELHLVVDGGAVRRVTLLGELPRLAAEPQSPLGRSVGAPAHDDAVGRALLEVRAADDGRGPGERGEHGVDDQVVADRAALVKLDGLI